MSEIYVKHMPAPKITIYSTPFCGYCQLVKQYLKKNNMAYHEIDVSVDERAQEEMIAKSKQMGVPVIIIEKDGLEEIMVGFQKEKLKELFDISE